MLISIQKYINLMNEGIRLIHSDATLYAEFSLIINRNIPSHMEALSLDCV